MYYTTNISGQTKKSKTSKGRPFIPPYYECNINVLGQGNFKFINGDLFVKPIIRTFLNDLKSYSFKGQESLGKTIKERMDSNSRLLLKKGLEKSLPQYINGFEYYKVEKNIHKINDNLFRIMNS